MQINYKELKNQSEMVNFINKYPPQRGEIKLLCMIQQTCGVLVYSSARLLVYSFTCLR